MLAHVFTGTSVGEAWTATRVFSDCVYLPTTTNDCFSMCVFLWLFKWIRGYFFELPASLVEPSDWVLEVERCSFALFDIAYEVVTIYEIYVCGEQSPSCFFQCLH